MKLFKKARAEAHGCPRCGSYKTVRYGSILNRIFRFLVGKNQKWRCNECETRFRPSIRGGISGRKRLILTAVVSCLFFLFIFHGLLTTHPKVWVKQQIVAVYKFAYGDEHKVKMHEQLGFLYDDLGDEMDDYQGHDF